jgi:hypothetical protein
MESLAGMTQDKWYRLSHRDRERLRDLSGLSSQLIGLEGWRVEVETKYGGVRRFIVGRSTGWVPCHIEVNNRRAHGGPAAELAYVSVRKLYKAR